MHTLRMNNATLVMWPVCTLAHMLTRPRTERPKLQRDMSSSAPVRVLLADDQAKVRSALRLLIEQELAFNVVGEASAADELLLGILRSYPQAVLLDWELPGLPGLPDGHKLDSLRLIDPHIRVIALSGQPEARASSISEGADMFVSKSEPPDGVLRALYFVRDQIHQQTHDKV
jgi:DNA-binding NarL/FixJ family response regulator